MKILAISAVSYRGFFSLMLFAFRKSTSNEMKWPTIGRSPTNSWICGANSSMVGAFLTSLSVMFVMCVMNSGILTPGSMKDWRVSTFSFGSRLNFVAPNSMIRLVRLSKPVVSRSSEINMFIAYSIKKVS